MVEFARYYIEFLRNFFANLFDFIKNFFGSIFKFFITDIADYFNQLVGHWAEFNFLDWLFLLVVIIVNTGLVLFLSLRLYQLLRRYIRFVRREIEKDALVEEITALNLKTAELLDEKNKILALKVGATVGAGAGGAAPLEAEMTDDKSGDGKKKAVGPSRFTKLIGVDQKYETAVGSVLMDSDDMVDLPTLIDRFINFAASQLRLFYDHRVIRAFFAGLATSKIIILEGISGTGKTSLPYAMGRFFKNPSAICSVQPSWRDRAEMIGYLNEFTKKFNETDFLKSLYEVLYRDDLNFIVLDEMNLARIEYYFAEFLSIMEMPNFNEWRIDIVPDNWPTDPKFLIEGKILVPQNLWFIGTANRDDSTFTITDKVYDRAVSIEMNYRADYIDAPFTDSINMSYDYINMMFKKGIENHPISTKNLEKLFKVDMFVSETFKITFGNRIMKQIKLFVPAYVSCGGEEIDGLDYIFLRKILRKFEALNIAFLKAEIGQLISLLDKLFGKNAFAESIKFLNELIKNN